MNIKRASPFNEWLAKVIFLILPTACITYFLVNHFSEYTAAIRSSEWQWASYFSAGMLGAALVYGFRFRFWLPFAALCFVLFSTYQGINSFASDEFDSLFITAQFQAFTLLLLLGWMVGWGFIRIRYWSVFMAGVSIASSLLLLSRMKPDGTSFWSGVAQFFTIEPVYGLLFAFAPALLYAIYIIFTAEQIYSYKDKSRMFWWFLSRRVLLFSVLALGLFAAVSYYLKDEIKETLANFGGGGKEGDNAMLKKNKDGTFDLKDYSQLRSNLGRSNELLFCAYIDNFFEGTDMPNPLYLTAFYYTKFDTLTETFERDSLIPNNDLFEPDVSQIPLFGIRTDSTVIRNSLSAKFRKEVEIQIYNKRLNPSTYLAPSTGYFVQPITIDRDFRDSFRSAYRAKSYVSELNSAYFIYNADDKQLRQFQENRFSVLRKYNDYSSVNKAFMDYYTQMPSDVKFNNIRALADSIAKGKTTVLDKVLAIRDHFLAKDENGKPVFKYTDNPGVPDIPSASKLTYFLFENKQGYCAYYAGATLFMLRALGIPSRITAGFLTEDRSDKNKGWYWYYANQAHAWVQVYFPGVGWMDFDTTVGNTDAQQAPQTDGTPPMQPPRAWLSLTGIISDVDTLKKLASLKINSLLFKDKEYDAAETNLSLQVDLHIAAIRRDSVAVPFSSIKNDEEATLVSYADAFKKMPTRDNESLMALTGRFPKPAPIDEVYLKSEKSKKPVEKTEEKEQEKQLSVKDVLRAAGIFVLAVLLLFFSIPLLIYAYYSLRKANARNTAALAYWSYRLSAFYLHQLGIFRNGRTPLQYAQQDVEPLIGQSYTQFLMVYLKLKYARQPLTVQEENIVKAFYGNFKKALYAVIKPATRAGAFLLPIRSIQFFVMAADKAAGPDAAPNIHEDE